MHTFGGDFNWGDAYTNFMNLDKLVQQISLKLTNILLIYY